MLRVKIILIGILFPFISRGQVIFKTIVSRQVITAGESFQIQYILDDGKRDNSFIPPFFKGFRIVSGPYTYKGSVNGSHGSNPLKNITYTLVAEKPGRYFIPGATAKVNGKLVKSDDVLIDVIKQKEAFEKSAGEVKGKDVSEYFLQPGEDPGEKMRQNLFMKVMVDKKSCYIGEPVVATFKLYSRLESKSDIVKNPGFYGFAVYDIINLNDHISATETIDGRPFDVHTVRRVQLYPLQAGIFTIDAMEVTNKCEFSKSAVYKKTEQEIKEGVFENNDPPARSNTVSYENAISTEKITIHVKPYPVIKKPIAFNGATGNFFINASLEKNELAKNEEGALIITISGKGNFTQLSAPVVQWPEGMETFDPVIKDSLDKTQAPLKGSRTFRFPFLTNKAGSYNIPSVFFTFFDPDSNSYKTVSASIPGIKISNEEIKEPVKEQRNIGIKNKKDKNSLLIYGGIFLVVLSIILLELRTTKGEKAAKEKVVEKIGHPVSTDQLLQPAQFSLIADDGNFYTLLQKATWDHLGTQLKLSGSKMNKDDLLKTMKEKNMEVQFREILAILQECEAAAFTKAKFANDKQELLNRAKEVLGKIKG